MGKDSAAPKKAETPAGGAPQGGAEQGQQQQHKKAEMAPPSRKGHNPMPGGCHAWGCKVSASRFNFCDEHYDHFKFGLIKKTGERVSDYDKKIEHYQAHQHRSMPMRKAA